MKYKLIAVDIDGTTLNSQHQLTERTKCAIIKTAKAGVLYVTATGRALKGVQFINDLFEVDLPFIIFNGASAVMGKSGAVLFDKYLDFEAASEAFEIGRSRSAPIVVWTDQGIWMCNATPKTIKYNESYGHELRIIEHLDMIRGVNIYKIFWMGSPTENARRQVEMNKYFDGKLNCFTSQPEYLEFVSPEVTKGSALEAIGRLYGIDKCEMIAVGDGYNDIAMLEYAGVGIAMGNAPDDVKAVCKHVACSNDEDGLAEVIEEFIL
ncbi:MAG: Cof-type HAD-IIB family hydrolase [Oscillospiraceae bacterium]|nr:Cof-type HAD-IIB family hydrolase [Oscillospiraceae bacterium]